MSRYAAWLFGLAAATNILVGALFLFGRGVLTPLLDLAPVTGTNVWFANMTAVLVILFGVVYACIARHPATWRPTIWVFALGKALAFALAAIAWTQGEVTAKLPLLIGGDLVFAALFVDYLRRTRARA
jgi:hypothetical protein